MRHGDNPDWHRWTAACRVQWARCMAEIARDEDFAEAVADELQWLRGATQEEAAA